jgi:hypothetical protein
MLELSTQRIDSRLQGAEHTLEVSPQHSHWVAPCFVFGKDSLYGVPHNSSGFALQLSTKAEATEVIHNH